MHRQPVASPNPSEPTKVELVRTRWVLKRASGCWTINTGVPADEGFWVGRPGSRVWVRLVTDKESGRRIRAPGEVELHRSGGGQQERLYGPCLRGAVHPDGRISSARWHMLPSG